MSGTIKVVREQFGELLSLYRVARGYSISDLAEAMGSSLSTIHAFEKGEVDCTLTDFLSFAGALDVPATEMLEQLQKRIEFFNQNEERSDDATLDFLASNRGRQVVRAMAVCRNPDLLDAVAGLLMSATVRQLPTTPSNDTDAQSSG